MAHQDIQDLAFSRIHNTIDLIPTLIIGSGASAVYGLPGMYHLSQYLVQNITPNLTGYDKLCWQNFIDRLSITENLEQSLHDVVLSESLLSQVVRETRNCIYQGELRALLDFCTQKKLPLLSRLFQFLFRSTHRVISVVTTNYDRIIECSADMAGFTHYTGFSYGYIQKRDDGIPWVAYRNQQKARLVEVWKVHGSVDWFRDENGQLLALPFLGEMPKKLSPVIVTPGLRKYQETHHEPFRSTMTGADKALSNARSYLCWGYGFNDPHIQTKLIDRVFRYGTPVVVIAKKLTDNVLSFFHNQAGNNYVGIEESSTSGSRIYIPESPNGVDIPNINLWDMDVFLKLLISN